LLPAVRSVIRITLLAVVGLAATGCRARPTAGTSCRVADQIVCSSRNSAVVCEAIPAATAQDSTPGATAQEGSTPLATPPTSQTQETPAATPDPIRTWTSVACKGARGCGRSVDRERDDDECDDTLAAPGDPCPRSPPLDYACATDLTTALVCKDGRFDLWRRCRGPQGCRVIDGRNVHCDTSLGEPDDPCEHSGTFACSVDGATMLECDGKALVPASSCRGPKACFFEKGESGAQPHKIDCDDGVAQEGDPCAQPRRITCALDHKEELVCDGHKFGKKRDCRRSDCRIDGTELFCD
jgi:hypothetical protein